MRLTLDLGPEKLGKYLIAFGLLNIFVFTVIGYFSAVDTSQSNVRYGPLDGLLIGLLTSAFLLYTGYAWLKSKKTGLYGLSLLVMFVSALMMGSSLVLLLFQGGNPAGIVVLVVTAVAAFFNTFLVRCTIRNHYNEMGWNEDSVYKWTSLKRTLIVAFLPTIILVIILLVIMYILLRAGAETMADTWTCTCGTTNYGGSICKNCWRGRNSIF